MNPTRLIRPVPLLLVALLALPCVVLPAQEEAPTTKAKPARIDSALITIDFPGGPLSKLAAKLNETGDTKLSIVQSPGLDPTLPAFSVRNVRVHAVIAALGGLLEQQGYRLIPVDDNLAVLSKIENPKQVTVFASFQLESKLGDGKVEDIITAIQQGCEFASTGKASTLRFKYHPGTKLLFVAGAPEEVDIAYRVYGSLPGYPPKGSPQPTPPAEKK